MALENITYDQISVFGSTHFICTSLMFNILKMGEWFYEGKNYESGSKESLQEVILIFYVNW